MKNTRRIAAFVASVLAVALMAAPMTSFTASAAADNTITINGYNTSNNNDNGTHTYEAYQVFTGQYAEGSLGNIEWGTGVNGDAIITALNNASATEGHTLYGKFNASTVKTAKDVAEVLATITDHDDGVTKAVAAIIGKNLTAVTSGTYSAGVISALDDGYYLIQDGANSPDGTLGDNNNGAKTRFILKVAGGENITVQAKSSAPSVVKKVQENTDVSDYTDPSNTVWNDYNDVADYNIGDSVPFLLVGTLPSTLDDYSKYKYVFNDTLDSQFTITDSTVVTVKIDGVDKTSSATVEKDVTNNKITVTFNDIIAAGATATSVVTVEYSATLNANAEIGLPGQQNQVYLNYSNNPNWTGTGDETPDADGETPVDKVIVFTYELDIQKYLNDESTKAGNLDGTKAGFKIMNSDGEFATIDLQTSRITGWSADEDAGTEITTDADGLVKIIGLDDGTYTIKETTTPTGYNTMADKPLTIDATTVNGQTWSEVPGDALTAIKLTMDNKDSSGAIDTGVVSGSIINQKGSSLPSTGGIGTTIFVVGGGAMVAAAGILLVSKKRMSK